MATVEIDLYEALGVSKTATQQQIKQAYKKLALKYHPDKNSTNKEQAKAKFLSISEAYTVLNDPEKRQNYDMFGTADFELDGMNFEDFMGDFDMFEEFLDQFMAFDTLQKMFNQMAKHGKKNKTGRAKGRKKNKSKNAPKNDMLDKDLEKMLMQALQGGMDFNDADFDMMGMDLEQAEKQLEKLILDSDDSDQDEQDLTQEQMNVLAFGERNIEKKKVGNKKKKKKETRCKICSAKIEDDEILLHFSQKHMKQFEEERKNGVKKTKIKSQQPPQKSKLQEKEEEFDY